MNFYAWVGLLVLLKFFYPLFKSLIVYILPPLNLKKVYNGWVVVTGSTDGIGKEICKRFAQQGFNICQISRSKEKLQQTEQELKKINKEISLKYIVADFSKCQEEGFFERIQSELKGIQIGIFVNNAGLVDITLLKDQSEQSCLDLINVNCVALAGLSNIYINQTKETKQKSLLINVSSVAGEKSTPYYTVYCATKAFVTALSMALREELRGTTKINLACFQPGFVSTQMIGNVSNGMLLTISTDEAVSGLFRVLGKQETFNGHWKHILSGFFLSTLKQILPERNPILDNMELKSTAQLRDMFSKNK